MAWLSSYTYLPIILIIIIAIKKVGIGALGPKLANPYGGVYRQSSPI
jgi:hypothetical protein